MSRALCSHCRIDCQAEPGRRLKAPRLSLSLSASGVRGGYIDFWLLLPDTEQYRFLKVRLIPILGPGTGALYGLCFTRRGLAGLSHLAGDRWFLLSADCSLPRFGSPSRPGLKNFFTHQPKELKEPRDIWQIGNSSISSEGRIHYPPVPAYLREI